MGYRNVHAMSWLTHNFDCNYSLPRHGWDYFAMAYQEMAYRRYGATSKRWPTYYKHVNDFTTKLSTATELLFPFKSKTSMCTYEWYIKLILWTIYVRIYP